MEWSVDGQTPEFLAATRMVTLRDSVIRSIMPLLHLEPGARVLDVGCGSGEYVFRLGAHVRGVDFTGVEYDGNFVEFATRRAAGEVPYPFEQPAPGNSYRFVQADGLDLPFEDGAFDAVVSHTYLTAVAQWPLALSEMCRVCKSGGTVSSVTSMTNDFYGTGVVGLFAETTGAEDAALLQRVRAAQAVANTGVDLVAGIEPRLVPAAFAHVGLEQVACVPLGHYFCLSDARTTPQDYRRYIDLLRAAEEAEYARLQANPDTAHMLTEGEWCSYRELIDARYQQLLDEQGDNWEWNWFGTSSLFVCGIRKQ